jgi:hypothetical protein
MDYAAHYRRACELAEQAEQAAHDAGAHLAANHTKAAGLLLRRAEVLARLAATRAQLAWVAYMGCDADAEALLATDAQIVPLTPRNATGQGADPAQADD